MERQNKTALDLWVKDYRAEVRAFIDVCPYDRKTIAKMAGFKAVSVLSKNLDPAYPISISFISKLSATFEGLYKYYGEYLAVRDGSEIPETREFSYEENSPRNPFEAKSAIISKKHKELVLLYEELEELAREFRSENDAS